MTKRSSRSPSVRGSRLGSARGRRLGDGPLIPKRLSVVSYPAAPEVPVTEGGAQTRTTLAASFGHPPRTERSRHSARRAQARRAPDGDGPHATSREIVTRQTWRSAHEFHSRGDGSPSLPTRPRRGGLRRVGRRCRRSRGGSVRWRRSPYASAGRWRQLRYLELPERPTDFRRTGVDSPSARSFTSKIDARSTVGRWCRLPRRRA